MPKILTHSCFLINLYLLWHLNELPHSNTRVILIIINDVHYVILLALISCCIWPLVGGGFERFIRNSRSVLTLTSYRSRLLVCKITPVTSLLTFISIQVSRNTNEKLPALSALVDLFCYLIEFLSSFVKSAHYIVLHSLTNLTSLLSVGGCEMLSHMAFDFIRNGTACSIHYLFVTRQQAKSDNLIVPFRAIIRCKSCEQQDTCYSNGKVRFNQTVIHLLLIWSEIYLTASFIIFFAIICFLIKESLISVSIFINNNL